MKNRFGKANLSKRKSVGIRQSIVPTLGSVGFYCKALYRRKDKTKQL